MAVIDRESILTELESRYVGNYATLTHNGIMYRGMINNINIEIDAVDFGDCTVTIHIGEKRIETSLELFIGNTSL